MNTTEAELTRIFEELLSISRPAADASFFDLGGHSLLAVRLVAAIKTRLGVTIPLDALFDEDEPPTVARLAVLVATSGPTGPVLLRAGAGDPLFCVHPAGGEVSGFRPLAELLDGPVYGLPAPPIDGPAGCREIAAIAEYHLAQIHGVQPRGPYRLLGWSMGGAIAQEIAGRWHASGERCAQLVLVDSYPGEVLDAPPDDGIPEPFLSHARALHRHRPTRMVGDVLLVFAADGDRARQDAAAAVWTRLCEGTVRRVTLPGDHYSVIAGPGLADVLTADDVLTVDGVRRADTASR